MLPRPLVGALLGGALFLTHASSARAQEQAAAGAIVIAITQDATPAAKPLARDVYRDPALRPTIDDATARVLAGEPLSEGAPAKLKEIGDLRASVATSGSEAASRRLLAAIGSDLRAKIVVSVTIEGGRPVAKVLRVETAAFEGIELGATTETNAAGEKIVQWPGAVDALHKLFPEAPPPPAQTGAPNAGATPAAGAPTSAGGATKPASPGKPGPKAPAKGGEESKSVWTSPWFWAVLGGAVAVGAGAFAIAKVTQDDGGGTLHLQGRVAR